MEDAQQRDVRRCFACMWVLMLLPYFSTFCVQIPPSAAMPSTTRELDRVARCRMSRFRDREPALRAATPGRPELTSLMRAAATLSRSPRRCFFPDAPTQPRGNRHAALMRGGHLGVLLGMLVARAASAFVVTRWTSECDAGCGDGDPTYWRVLGPSARSRRTLHITLTCSQGRVCVCNLADGASARACLSNPWHLVSHSHSSRGETTQASNTIFQNPWSSTDVGRWEFWHG